MKWCRGPALVVALCAAGLAETWAAYGPDPARMALIVGLVTPLLWTRPRPALVMPLIAGVFLLQLPIESLRVLERTFVCYLALIWAAYACARHAASAVTIPAAAAGPIVGGATVGLVDGSTLSGALAASILAVPLWVGYAVRTRVTARRTLARQAREIADATAAAAAAHASESRARVAAELQATLAERVQAMVDQARCASDHLPRDPVTAARAVAAVEADGRSALHDMRLTLRAMREDAPDSRQRSCATAPQAPSDPAMPSPRGPSGVALGLAIATAAVVVFNLAAGFTSAADFGFPLLLVALAGAGVVGLRRQTELLAAVRQQTDELESAREAATRAAGVQERLRLARELHDVVAHHLMVMVVQAGAARRTLESGRTGSCDSLTVVERTGSDVIGELRSLLDLVDPGADTGPAYGMADLEALVDRARAGGLEVELTIDGDRRSLPGGLDLAARRIVQESLTNVMRHAGASRVGVLVHYGFDQLTIEITDNGRGLADGPNTGLGLLGMRERAAMYGGSCAVDEVPVGGVRVLATLPLDRESVRQ